jgi:hypothetical protein
MQSPLNSIDMAILTAIIGTATTWIMFLVAALEFKYLLNQLRPQRDPAQRGGR